jgi:hypothetical protein
MTPGQRKTAVRLGFALLALLGVGVLVLAIELHGAAAHDQASISELLWLLWARQPWVVLLATHLVAGPAWFLAGHFFAQSRSVYERIRGEAL